MFCSEGEAVAGSYSFRFVSSLCDFSSFAATKKSMDAIIDIMDDQIYEPEELSAIQFQLDSLKYLDSWTACQTLLENLIQSSTQTVCECLCY